MRFWRPRPRHRPRRTRSNASARPRYGAPHSRRSWCRRRRSFRTRSCPSGTAPSSIRAPRHKTPAPSWDRPTRTRTTRTFREAIWDWTCLSPSGFWTPGRLAARGVRARRRLVGFLQLVDVDLAHLEHRFHHSLRLLGILVGKHVRQRGGNDLPRQTELVLEPAALRRRTAPRQELVPQLVHFRLGFAAHVQRDRFGELENRAAVQRHELLPLEL